MAEPIELFSSSAAIRGGLIDVSEDEQMIDDIEVLRDVRTAVQQIDAGQGVSSRDAKAELRRRFGR
jgi:hypothetical protein